MKKTVSIIFILSCLLAAQRNYLLLSQPDIESIRNEGSKYELFRNSFNNIKNDLDKAINQDVDVPIPIDAAAYTHERHKQNYTLMYNAGMMFAFTGEKQYVEFVKSMLTKYANLYPTLSKHPAAASETPGRLFWQSLNETVWLFYTIQAYDFVKDYLSPADRVNIENNIFKKSIGLNCSILF